MLRKDVEFELQDDHLESFEKKKKDLLQATKTTVRLAKPGQQYVILCDARYYSSGFVLKIEDYLVKNDAVKKQAYAPVSFGSQLFNTSQLKVSTYSKELLALYFALENFSHSIWGAEKPVIVLTDHHSLTSFFQSNSLHPSLWNFMDRIIAYNLVLAHIPGKANAAADFLSGMQTDPIQCLELQLVYPIPMKQIELDRKAKTPDAAMLAIESLQEVEAKPTVLKELIEKIQSNDALQHLIPNLDKILKSASNDQKPDFYTIKRATETNSIQEKDPLNYFQVSNLYSKALDIEPEQKEDPVLRKVMTWIDTGCNDDLTYASLELRKYYNYLTRLQMQKGILVRQFFNDVGKISLYQIFVPKHLRKEVVYRIHNSPTGGHLGIVRTAKVLRQQFYFPGFTEFLTD